MWKTILNIRHKAILAIAVLAACGIVTFVLSRKKLEQEEAKRERKEIGDLRNAEWEWSKSVLSPKSGNPKVFFDKLSFEHGLFHVVDGVQYDSRKRIGTISTRVWNDSDSTISECWFSFALIDAKTRKEIWIAPKGLMKKLNIPMNSARGVKLTFELPVETFEGIEDWEQNLFLYEVKREHPKWSRLVDGKFEPIKNIPLH
jgi:hypothetical protein